MKNSKIRDSAPIDPLYTIFEHHLCNFQDSDIDRRTFIDNVVTDYLSHLRKQKIAIPRELEIPVAEEIFEQVNTMLVKKIYGFFTIEEFQQNVPLTTRKKARRKYASLKQAEKTSSKKGHAGDKAG